jgi:hypothetical protein
MEAEISLLARAVQPESVALPAAAREPRDRDAVPIAAHPPVPPVPPAPRVDAAAAAGEPARSPQAEELVQVAIAAKPSRDVSLPPMLPSSGKTDSISIGRVEVQVNNLPAQPPTVAQPRAAAVARTAGLPGAYYLDRFSLRP